jgi:hypothetical protein
MEVYSLPKEIRRFSASTELPNKLERTAEKRGRSTGRPFGYCEGV